MDGKLPPLVLIEWEDSAQAAPQWQWLSEAVNPPMSRCRSVGFLVKNTKEEKALAISAASALNDGAVQVSGIITIPSRCVLRMDRVTCPSSRRRPYRGAGSDSKRKGI